MLILILVCLGVIGVPDRFLAGASAALRPGGLAPGSALNALPALQISIEEDRGYSGDQSTLCRVRVVNHGRETHTGSDIRFEARAIRDGRIAARQRGRFGLTLGPHETLETQVAFLGRFDRFEVVLADGGGHGGGGGKKGKKGKAKTGAKRPSRSRKLR